MRSSFFVFLLSSSAFLIASATSEPPVEEVKTTPAPAEEVKTSPPAVEEVKTTPASEEVKETAAAVEEVKTTPAPEGDVKSTGVVEEEVKTTDAPVEELKATEGPVALAPSEEKKEEASNTTEQPKEEKKEEEKEEEKKEEEKKEEKKEEEKKEKEEEKKVEEEEAKEEEKLEIFDKALLSDALVGEDEKKHRKHELIKKVVKKMDLDGAITPEEIETIISDVPDFETKDETLQVAVEIESKPKKLVMARENGPKGPLVRPAKPDMTIMPVDEKKPQILPYPVKFDKSAQIGQAIKASFERLRGGRGLINIERIDKIDVKVYTYEKKN